jgi:hypothetical protein
MTGGEAIYGIWMEHTRTRKPSFGKSKAASPIEPALLTTPPERYPPQAKHPVPENTETIKIPRNGAVVEIALQETCHFQNYL